MVCGYARVVILGASVVVIGVHGPVLINRGWSGTSIAAIHGGQELPARVVGRAARDTPTPLMVFIGAGLVIERHRQAGSTEGRRPAPKTGV